MPTLPGRGDGPGIFLGEWDDGRWLAGVDLDMCLTDGGLLEGWAADIVTRFRTYAEVSPSGAGLKIFGWCSQPVPCGETRSRHGHGTTARAGMPSSPST